MTDRNKEIPSPCPDNALFWARVHEKLAAYEDTGYSPIEIKSLQGEWNAMSKVIDSYRKAEEQGRLVILPCKVGDTVFVITERSFIAKGEVRNFRFFDKLIVDVEYHHFGTCATSRFWAKPYFSPVKKQKRHWRG